MWVLSNVFQNRKKKNINELLEIVEMTEFCRCENEYLSLSFFFFYALKSEHMQRLPNACFSHKTPLLADTVPRPFAACTLPAA
jgi:hypothetical protein